MRQVIYEGIVRHASRAAGHEDWDLYGPSYALSGNGVVYSGPFHSRFTGSTLKVVKKSHFVRFVLNRIHYRSEPSHDDIERYARILERSAQLAREKYGAGFTIVFWDDVNESSRRIMERLRKTTIPLVLVSDVIREGNGGA